MTTNRVLGFRSRVAALVVGSLFVLPAPTAGAVTGRLAPTVGADAARVAVGSLTPRRLGPGAPRPHGNRALVLPFHDMAPGPLRAARAHAAARASVGQRRPLTVQKPPLTGLFNGLNAEGLNDFAVTPPDSTGAIGPNHYVEAVNQQIGAYDRTLGLVSSTDMGSFTGASASNIVSD